MKGRNCHLLANSSPTAKGTGVSLRSSSYASGLSSRIGSSIQSSVPAPSTDIISSCATHRRQRLRGWMRTDGHLLEEGGGLRHGQPRVEVRAERRTRPDRSANAGELRDRIRDAEHSSRASDAALSIRAAHQRCSPDARLEQVRVRNVAGPLLVLVGSGGGLVVLVDLGGVRVGAVAHRHANILPAATSHAPSQQCATVRTVRTQQRWCAPLGDACLDGLDIGGAGDHAWDVVAVGTPEQLVHRDAQLFAWGPATPVTRQPAEVGRAEL